MNRYRAFAVIAALGASTCAMQAQTAVAKPPAEQSFDGPARSWLRQVRIAAYPLTISNADEIVRQAEASGVYGIEVDNDIPGRYESLLDPKEKLEAIRRVAAAAHRHHNKAFVYVAGTECISLNADGQHTLAKDHPDWLQRKITGEPAIFSNNAAFWIRKGEEDAWISPYAPEWRALYMERIRQIAATGIDGIYVDIPYWMTHFTGWEDTWASFDDATVAAFRRETGLDARKDVKIGDFQDPNFRKWVDFRIRTITDFLIDIRANATKVSPDISVIPEIYPGIEEESPRVGADVYQIYPHVDAIAHEYEFGGGDDHTAASRTPFDWMMYQIGLRSFRAFAGDRSTWILNYSWDGAPHVKPRDAMLNLAMSELMAGANLWDAKGHVMSGSNDMATRTEIYHWVAAHQAIFSGAAHADRRCRRVLLRHYAKLLSERVHRVLSWNAIAPAAGTYPVPDSHATHAGDFRRQHIDTSRRSRSQRSGVLCCASISAARRQTYPDRCARREARRYCGCRPLSG